MRPIEQFRAALVGALPTAVLVLVTILVLTVLDGVVRTRKGMPAQRAAAAAAVDGLLLFTVIGVLLVTLWPAPTASDPAHRVNLVPLRGVVGSLSAPRRTQIGVLNLIGNTLLFAPLGLLAPLRWHAMRSAARITVAAAALSTAIEVLQYVLPTGRFSDINDVISNTAGALVGFALLVLIRTVRPPPR